MNCDTGELRRLLGLETPPEGFVQVPDDLAEEAEKELGENQSVFVDLKQRTPLANFAKSQRTQAKKNTRKRMSKASKRKNRK
jgi:hypothetical protein